MVELVRAKKQIERGIGDVAEVAYWMLLDGHVSVDWTKTQIERGIGDYVVAGDLIAQLGYI